MQYEVVGSPILKKLRKLSLSVLPNIKTNTDSKNNSNGSPINAKKVFVDDTLTEVLFTMKAVNDDVNTNMHIPILNNAIIVF